MSAGTVDILADVLRRATGGRDTFRVLLERGGKDPNAFTEAAAVVDLTACQAALSELERLIADGCAFEPEFQKLLTRNPWMFGSEYSALLDKSGFRRTTDHRRLH
jgi:hypothetical protein